MLSQGDYLYLGATSSSTSGVPRLLRHHGPSDRWEVVFEPELIEANARSAVIEVQLAERGIGRHWQQRQSPKPIARDSGFRSLTTFKGESDARRCIYASTLSHWGGRILRSEDGTRFEQVGEPGLGNDEVLSFRGMAEFNGKLFMAPVGTTTETRFDRNLAPEATVYVSTDPASGRWEKACEDNFGDPNNKTIFSLAATSKFLYAGTGNPYRGFQLWRTDASGKPPFAWTRVLTDGAYRYAFNYATAAMVEFRGALYVGGGIPGFGYDKPHDIGPAACELVRVHPDDSWDLIFGEPRFTPDGLKVPLSAMGPGLDNVFNSVVWSIGVHAGVLYVGTHNWEPFDCINNNQPLSGGYELWGTPDGETWTRVLDGGNGNSGSTGIRTLCSAPSGLYIGVANHTRLLQTLGGLKGRRDDVSRFSAGFEILRGA